jgi:hypothetical protein
MWRSDFDQLHSYRKLARQVTFGYVFWTTCIERLLREYTGEPRSLVLCKSLAPRKLAARQISGSFIATRGWDFRHDGRA